MEHFYSEEQKKQQIDKLTLNLKDNYKKIRWLYKKYPDSKEIKTLKLSNKKLKV